MSKTIVFAGALGGLLLASTATLGSPYQGMTIEEHHDHDWGTSYRIYVDLDAGARVDAVYGNSEGTLEIKAENGAVHYHDAAGGATSQSINSAFFIFVPAMQWDSYVSIGALHSDGHPFAGGNNLNDIGIDFADWEGNVTDLVTDNGSWFVTPDDAQGEEQGGRVFVAQITVADEFSELDITGQVNLQGKDADGNTWNAIGATWVPAPGALALLGLAGIAGPRRRRA